MLPHEYCASYPIDGSLTNGQAIANACAAAVTDTTITQQQSDDIQTIHVPTKLPASWLNGLMNNSLKRNKNVQVLTWAEGEVA